MPDITLPDDPRRFDMNARGRNDWFRARRLSVDGLRRGTPSAYVAIEAYSDRGRPPNFAPLHLQLTPVEARTVARTLLTEANAAETEPTEQEKRTGSGYQVIDVDGERPFVWVKVEGGIADYGGDIDIVQVEAIDFDVSEAGEQPEIIGEYIAAARRIPDRLANLPHDDPRWLDREGIIASLTDDLIEVEYGICDDCPEVYELASRSDHCVEEGQCWEHCADSDAHEKAQTDEVLALTEEVTP